MQELATHVHTAVLVEGDSDRRAVEALARRAGRDLDAEGVAIVAIGGATNASHAVRRYGPTGRGVRLAALCDVAERDHFIRAHEAWRTGGLFVCDADLEDELIRAIGTTAMVAFVEAQGEATAFDTFQRQPFQRGRPLTAQLRRFIGTKSGRKIRYGAALVDAMPLEAIPVPLRDLLAAILNGRRGEHSEICPRRHGAPRRRTPKISSDGTRGPGSGSGHRTLLPGTPPRRCSSMTA